MIFVDTNIFIHSLFTVDRSKQERCKTLLEQAARGQVKLWTTEWVIAECIWFLARQKVSREQILSIIKSICSTTGLSIRNKSNILTALDLWNDQVDYVDAYNYTLMKEEGIEELYSFDKGLSTLPDTKRIVP